MEDSKRYPDIQSEFFERAAGPLTRRESVFSFLALGEPPQLPAHLVLAVRTAGAWQLRFTLVGRNGVRFSRMLATCGRQPNKPS